jgi:hypothetical protein
MDSLEFILVNEAMNEIKLSELSDKCVRIGQGIK